MESIDPRPPARPSIKNRLRSHCAKIPMLGWLAGVLGAVGVEHLLGDWLSYILYLPKIPVLFGCLIIWGCSTWPCIIGPQSATTGYWCSN
jgi:hypothetical protein